MNARPPRITHSLSILARLFLPAGCTGEAAPGGTESTSTLSTGDPSLPVTPTSGPDQPADTSTTTSPADPGTTAGATDPTSTTGEAGPTCGDGVVDRGEQCDDGAANSDSAFCSEQCKLHYCGDGNVFIGSELCDEGPANSDLYGSACTNQCVPGKRCGDGIVQGEEGEECDLGPDNGGNRGDEQGILCESSCRHEALRAFVTSQAYSGALGGITGADKKCSDAAEAAGLRQPWRFHAYLSTPDSPANARFPGPGAEPVPYILVTGMKLADSHAKLLELGPLWQGLSVTEVGVSLYNERVASNTGPGGNSYSPDQHCMAWTSADVLLKAHVGYTFPGDPDDVQGWATDGDWIDFVTIGCNAPVLHLYCLEI